MSLENNKFAIFKTLIELSSDCFLWISLEGRILYVSPGIESVTGFKPEDFLEDSVLFRRLVHPDDYGRYLENIQKKIDPQSSSGSSIEFRIMHGDGSVRWIKCQSCVHNTDEEPRGHGIILRDITKEKNDIHELLLMKQIIEQSAEAVAIINTSGSIDYVNSAFEQITGYSLEDTRNSHIPTIDGDDGDSRFADMIRTIKNGGTWRGQNRFMRKDGTEFYLDSVVFPLRGENGEIVNYVKVSRDITLLKKSEVELKESEAKIKAILNLHPDMIFIQDREGRYLDFYTGNTDLLYVAPEKFLGKKMDEIFPENEFRNFIRHYERTFASGGVEFYEYQLEINNETRYFESRMVPYGGDRILSIIRDVTDRIKSEQEKLNLQKLESVGILAGGIAHDFNNILSGVLGNLELAKMEFPEDHAAYGYLERAHRGLQRATGLTNQLLTFARGGEPVLGNVDLRELVMETVQFNLSGSNIKANFSFQEDLWTIKADKGQVEQVFGNLTINAKQAMPEGGSLFIEARNTDGCCGFEENKRDGKFVILSFRDEGSGIPEEIQKKIFDPYFSTKEKGSGLGLSTVHSIMIKHGGHIEVFSQPGKGTIFTLYFPAAELYTDQRQISAHSGKPVDGNKRVLVMDDEKIVRKVMVNMLAKMGFSVDAVSDGKEVVEAYEKSIASGSPYDIVIMDLTIPGGMGGMEALEHLKRIDENVRAVVTSGYSIDPVMAHYREYGFSGCIVKPFTMSSLRESLSDFL